jgi:YHS domain-containing protein
MRHTILGIAVVIGAGVMGIATAAEAEGAAPAAQPAKLQTTCPVMGGEINRNLYVDYEGKRIYVCCKTCLGTLQKDPAKYIKKLEDSGVTVATLQAACPVMGEKVNRDLYVDYEGKRIYVCCKDCIDAVKKDPAKYVASLEKAGVALDKVPETRPGG